MKCDALVYYLKTFMGSKDFLSWFMARTQFDNLLSLWL